jgi:molybdate-binding protein/DNA-binding transcriptional regulator YhcF (GntR family)
VPSPEEPHLYQKIAESLRREIITGRFQPGDRLPGIRDLTREWGCTPGTVQKAFRDLSEQGLIISRPGQGTHVRANTAARDEAPLRWASLVHRAEAFLLEVLTAGHTPEEAERAVRAALDRWRTLAATPAPHESQSLRFVGSHDPAVALIAARFGEISSGWQLELTLAGSLGGLMALARGEADLAGSHLWDAETDSYNAPFVRRLLPGRRIALLTLAHRRLGLVVAPGNPLGITTLADLARPGLRFVNRQRGSGTRVWLDVQLGRLGVVGSSIAGFGDERASHGDVTRAVAEGLADVGLAVEAAARECGLDFVPLTSERYDLVVPAETWDAEPLLALRRWLGGGEARSLVAGLGGYDVAETGTVRWVE